MNKKSIVFYIYSIFKYQFLSIKAAVDMSFYRFITLHFMRALADLAAACLMTFHCFIVLPFIVVLNFIILIGNGIFRGKKKMIKYFKESKEAYEDTVATVKRDYHSFLNQLDA